MKLAGRINALRRVQSTVFFALSPRLVPFRTPTYLYARPSPAICGAVAPLSKSAFALKNNIFSPLLGRSSAILREAD